MARRPKDDKPQDQKSNVPPETIRSAVRECSQLKAAIDAATGEYRACLKKWKSQGVNPKMIAEVIQARKVDPGVIQQEMRERIRYLALFNMPTKQSDLFNGLDLSGTTQKEQAEHREWEAKTLGYEAGYAGKPIDENPWHDKPGSESFVNWREGWQDGQAALARQTFHKPEKADIKQASTRRRRNKETLAETEAAGQA